MEELRKLARRSSKRTMTLVYGAADEAHNQAVVLKELIDELAWPLSSAPKGGQP